jgi:hypothetical protein
VRKLEVFFILAVVAVAVFALRPQTPQPASPVKSDLGALSVDGIRLGQSRDELEQRLNSDYPYFQEVGDVSYVGKADLLVGFREQRVVHVLGRELSGPAGPVSISDLGQSEQKQTFGMGERHTYSSQNLYVWHADEEARYELSTLRSPPRKPLGPRGTHTLVFFYAKHSEWCFLMEVVLRDFASAQGLEVVEIEAHPNNPDMRILGRFFRKAEGNVPFTALLDSERNSLVDFVGYKSYEQIEGEFKPHL